MIILICKVEKHKFENVLMVSLIVIRTSVNVLMITDDTFLTIVIDT